MDRGFVGPSVQTDRFNIDGVIVPIVRSVGESFSAFRAADNSKM